MKDDDWVHPLGNYPYILHQHYTDKEEENVTMRVSDMHDHIEIILYVEDEGEGIKLELDKSEAIRLSDFIKLIS